MLRISLGVLLCVLLPAAGPAGQLAFAVKDADGLPIPCRIHLSDEEGKAHHPPGAPFWRGGFVYGKPAIFEVPVGRYRYEVERGPEWEAERGEVEVVDGQITRVRVSLGRLADLKAEGWFAGDLHVHRAPGEMPQHLRAEDLSIASVQTWWNKSNLWAGKEPPAPVVESGGRFYHLLGGEDERGGGALLYHRMKAPIDITKAEREWPSSLRYLEEARRAGGWAEIEKPFWWDAPLWLSTGQIGSVGIAQNHMNRRGVLENEAWGRARDRAKYPGLHGNGLYTQDLYYKILNCGLRIPPSAGSASGVLPNPVGYNRVYVQVGAELTWDAWWDGLRKGRSFVTNGPLLRLTANGKLPGEILASGGPLKVVIEGKLASRDAIAKIELVRNGELSEVEMPHEFMMEESGWFLVRAITGVQETFRFASTAPWHVEVGGEAMVARREAAEFFLRWARERKEMVEPALSDPAQRAEVGAAHEKAVEFWERVAAGAE